MMSSETPEPTASALSLERVRFTWEPGGGPDLSVDALQVAPGERLFVEGSSGSGKSTLLGLLAGVLVPQAGGLTVLGTSFGGLGASARDRFRADHIGYLFQMFNLLPYLSVVENVTLPLRFSSRRSARVKDPASEAGRLLDHLGMGGLMDRPVGKLSVGQQQRVAAARALIGGPEIVLADEPTSSLDAAHAESFIQLLFDECKAAGTTLVFVSHDTRLASLFDRRHVLGA